MNLTGMHLLLGASNAMHRLRQQIRQVESTQAPVLIYGEKGAGKTLVADLILQESPRRDRPFVTFGCTGMPADLLERELFGFEGIDSSGA